MPKLKENQLTTKGLISRVCESSGYHKYEVEDVYSHILAHIKLALMKGETVRLTDFGTFQFFKKKGRKFYSALTGEHFDNLESHVISFKMERSFNKMIREENAS